MGLQRCWGSGFLIWGIGVQVWGLWFWALGFGLMAATQDPETPKLLNEGIYLGTLNYSKTPNMIYGIFLS